MDIELPDLGENIEEAEVLEALVQKGDADADEPILEVEERLERLFAVNSKSTPSSSWRRRRPGCVPTSTAPGSTPSSSSTGRWWRWGGNPRTSTAWAPR